MLDAPFHIWYGHTHFTDCTPYVFYTRFYTKKNEKKIHGERDLYDFLLTNVLKEKHNV